MTVPTLAAQIEALAAETKHDTFDIRYSARHKLARLLDDNLPAIVTALRQAEAAPGVAEDVVAVRRILAAYWGNDPDGADEVNEYLSGARDSNIDFVNALTAYRLARQHGAREAGEVETCCCQSFPTHCANDCPLHGAC